MAAEWSAEAAGALLGAFRQHVLLRPERSIKFGVDYTR